MEVKCGRGLSAATMGFKRYCLNRWAILSCNTEWTTMLWNWVTTTTAWFFVIFYLRLPVQLFCKNRDIPIWLFCGTWFLDQSTNGVSWKTWILRYILMDIPMQCLHTLYVYTFWTTSSHFLTLAKPCTILPETQCNVNRVAHKNCTHVCHLFSFHICMVNNSKICNTWQSIRYPSWNTVQSEARHLKLDTCWMKYHRLTSDYQFIFFAKISIY